MIIDCDSCEVRGLACGDCVVTVLLGSPPGGVELDREEQQAIEVLAGTGLVPPLRLVSAPIQAGAPPGRREAGEQAPTRGRRTASG